LVRPHRWRNQQQADGGGHHSRAGPPAIERGKQHSRSSDAAE
jgi:hypothetical protein